MGRKGRMDDTRELIEHSNYIIVYGTAGDTLDVVNVQHRSSPAYFGERDQGFRTIVISHFGRS